MLSAEAGQLQVTNVNALGNPHAPGDVATRTEWPAMLLDFCDSGKGVKLNDPDAVPQLTRVSQEDIASSATCGFASFLRVNGQSERCFFAVFSHHQVRRGGLVWTDYASDCWLRIGSRRIDLRAKGVRTEWTNGLFVRRFEVSRENEIVLELKYRRQWICDLRSLLQEPDLRGAPDFFAYVHKVASSHA